MMDEKKLADQNNIVSESSRVSSDEETRITIKAEDNLEDIGIKSGDLDEKSKGLVPNKELNDEMLRGVGDRYSCVVNVKCGKVEGDSQRLCRICHLSKSETEKDTVDLIEIGCGCKGELGFAHSYCVEAWFKLKGNRICEICGKTASNVTGITDSRFMEEWNEDGLAGLAATLSERRRGCWHGQPLCNFLMACLVLAFVLPWFFRVNMF